MASYESTIEVSTSPERAFAQLADVASASTWDPSIVESQRLDDGPLGIGSRFRIVVAFFGRRIEIEQVLEQADEPKTIVLVGKNKNVESRTSYAIEAHNGGSRIATVSNLKLKGALRLLDKGMQVTYTNMGQRSSEALRQHLSA